MKYLSILFITTFILIEPSCATRKAAYVMSGDVEYVAMNSDVLTYRCKGYGNNEKAALFDAQNNAFKILLFRGVPGSSFSAPMISVNESNEMNKNKTYFDKFLNEGRCLSFVTNSIVKSDYKKDKVIILEISINTRSLKQDLVNNKVLSEYGF